MALIDRKLEAISQISNQEKIRERERDKRKKGTVRKLKKEREGAGEGTKEKKSRRKRREPKLREHYPKFIRITPSDCDVWSLYIQLA